MHIFSLERKCFDNCTYVPIYLFLVVQASQSNRRTIGSNEDIESECGRLVGTVRRHTPIDTRDPIG